MFKISLKILNIV